MWKTETINVWDGRLEQLYFQHREAHKSPERRATQQKTALILWELILQRLFLRLTGWRGRIWISPLTSLDGKMIELLYTGSAKKAAKYQESTWCWQSKAKTCTTALWKGSQHFYTTKTGTMKASISANAAYMDIQGENCSKDTWQNVKDCWKAPPERRCRKKARTRWSFKTFTSKWKRHT